MSIDGSVSFAIIFWGLDKSDIIRIISSNLPIWKGEIYEV
jgi:hypothetical protein